MALGGRVRVPTTLNVGSMDLIHPELFQGPPALAAAGRELMEAHEALGCLPTFTCAPYQTHSPPPSGRRSPGRSATPSSSPTPSSARAPLATATSSTSRRAGRPRAFGSACTLPENRAGTILFAPPGAAQDFPVEALAVRGWIPARRRRVGERGARDHRPAADPGRGRRRPLKALGAVAASAGGWRCSTPSASPRKRGSRRRARRSCPRRSRARRAVDPDRTVPVTARDLGRALGTLSTAGEGAPLGAVALGTPHFSLPSSSASCRSSKSSSRPRASTST